MKTIPPFLRLWLILAACAGLTGCRFLKPARSTARYFVLTPLAGPGAAGAPDRAPLAVGVGQVKLPAYLLEKSLAVRQGTNEIEYLPSAFWPERLDHGLQRVLAANLSTLLRTDRIRLSAWRSEDVSVEVYVVLERFDVDSSGHGELIAWWRVLSPGGEKTLQAGESRLARQGPPPASDPGGATATLSDLAGELSQVLAQAIRETATPPGAR